MTFGSSCVYIGIRPFISHASGCFCLSLQKCLVFDQEDSVWAAKIIVLNKLAKVGRIGNDAANGAPLKADMQTLSSPAEHRSVHRYFQQGLAVLLTAPQAMENNAA